jgi:hypothetical protein
MFGYSRKDKHSARTIVPQFQGQCLPLVGLLTVLGSVFHFPMRILHQFSPCSLLFYPECGNTSFLANIGKFLPDYLVITFMVILWESQIHRCSCYYITNVCDRLMQGGSVGKSHIAHLRQQCQNSKRVIFHQRLLKILKCYNFLWVQQRHNCSPTASSANCIMALYMLRVHLPTFLSIPVTQKCQILSCDPLVANEQYI